MDELGKYRAEGILDGKAVLIRAYERMPEIETRTTIFRVHRRYDGGELARIDAVGSLSPTLIENVFYRYSDTPKLRVLRDAAEPLDFVLPELDDGARVERIDFARLLGIGSPIDPAAVVHHHPRLDLGGEVDSGLQRGRVYLRRARIREIERVGGVNRV